MTRIVSVLAFATCLAWTIPAIARPTGAQKCEAAKLRAAGQKSLCQAKTLAKQALGRDADLAKCEANFSAAFEKAEAKGDCATTEDAGTVASRIDAALIAIDAVLTPFGRFQDNFDGTVTDYQTGLQWEKKVAGFGCLHCIEDFWFWSITAIDADGDLFTEFLRTLNQPFVFELSPGLSRGVIIPPIFPFGCFADHCDWRLPTAAELSTIVDPAAGCNPCNQICVDPIFGARSFQGLGQYWTSETYGTTGTDRFLALTVQFCGSAPGTIVPYDKIDPARVRAVRGGY